MYVLQAATRLTIRNIHVRNCTGPISTSPGHTPGRNIGRSPGDSSMHYMGGLCGTTPRLRREKQARLHPKGGACDENKSAPYVNFRVATNFVTLVNLVNSPTWISLIWHSIMFVSAGHKHTIVQGVRYVYVHFGCTHNLRSCGTICVYIYIYTI